MTPFSGLLFFYVMGLLLLPAIALGLWGKPLRHYGLAFTVFMLSFIFGENGQLWKLAAFYLWQIALCVLFFRVRLRRLWMLWVTVVLALMPLIASKVGEVALAANPFQLMGVSYMTFRGVQVLLDVHDGKVKELRLLELSYFLLFFPSVASGPIDRYRRFVGDLNRKLNRQEYIDLLHRGIWKLLFGAFSCIVVSGLLWNHWLMHMPKQGIGATISYMYGYAFYLFFNFAGYSSMAIGTSYILGISLPENFNMPFFSVDMKDFWSRWHISLSSWLRDYVYTRFVMGSLKAKRFKNKRTAGYIGNILTMMAMGAWHGLAPAYLLYGVYHSALMCVNEALDVNWKPFRRLKQRGWTQVACVVVTFHIFSFGLLMFSGRLFS